MTTICHSESRTRLYEKLHRDLGETIINYLLDRDVNELMLNPDGKLWIDSATSGQRQVVDMDRAQALSIINGVAGINSLVVTQSSPRLEAEFPRYKHMNAERFTAQIPPIVSAPCFTIRKKSESIFSLNDYLSTDRISKNQFETLKDLVANRKNILICGGPGSGKTTVTNALIMEAVHCDANQRFLILEDIPELQCSAQNKVAMVTSDNVSMTGLLRSAMRMRPDRILIGEVRGAEALDMLKAWNTGCPGGICTVHANGAEEAIQRICDLAMEAGLSVRPNQLVLHTIDAVVSVVRRGHQKGFIEEILALRGHGDDKFTFEKLA